MALKPEHEQFIQSQRESGNNVTVDESVNETVNLFREHEQRLATLRQLAALTSGHIVDGQATDGETVFARLQATISSL